MKKFDNTGFLLYSAQSKPFLMCELHQDLVFLADERLETAFLIDMIRARVEVINAKGEPVQIEVFKSECAGVLHGPCADAPVPVLAACKHDAVVRAVIHGLVFVDHAFANDVSFGIKDQEIVSYHTKASQESHAPLQCAPRS